MIRLRRKLLLAALGVVVPLGAAELVLRLIGFELPPLPPPIVIFTPTQDERLAETEQVHEPAPRQLWRPRAGAAVPWGDAEHERINAAGCRGPELAREKSAGVLRIAAFGDSSTFGLGVAWRETYAARLVDELAAADVRAEVIDAGVIGFTVAQGLERYQELVRELRPDVVTLAFGAVNEHLPANDFEDREKIEENARRASKRRPLANWLREHLRVAQFVAWLGERRAGIDRDELVRMQREERRQLKELKPSRGEVDWPGKRRVSLPRFEEDLTRFISLASADGARTILLISMPRSPEREAAEPVLLEYSKVVVAVGAKVGVRVFDARARIAAELAAGVEWNDLFLDAYHPSPRGHALFARELAQLLLAR